MVQLLLLLNLLSILALFILLVNLYLNLRELRFKYEEVEKELLKSTSSLGELSSKVEQVEAKLSFLQKEIRLITEKVGRI
jgi:chromosome segregation ATPase